MHTHTPTARRSLKSLTMGGAASAALLVGMLAAPTAQALLPEWSDEVDVATFTTTTPDHLTVTVGRYFDGSSFVQPIAVAYEDGPAGSRTVKVSVSTDSGATFSTPVDFSATCTSVGSLATALYDDTLAAAYTCDDTVVVSTASLATLATRSDIDVSRPAAASNSQVGIGFAGRPTGSAFSPVVSWVEDGASDDTGYLALSTSGIDNTWNRDDSPAAIATGTSVISSQMLHPLGFQGGSSVVAFNADDTVSVTKVPRFFTAFTPFETYTVATGVSGVPSLAGSGDLEYILASWTNSDDTVQSVLSSQGSGGFPNPAYDVTSTPGDRGAASAALGYSGSTENIARRILVFDDTVSGTRQVTGVVSDDSTTFASTRVSPLGETVLSPARISPLINANSFNDGSAVAYWVSDFGGAQRVKAVVGSEVNPANGSTFTWSSASSVFDDVATVTALAGYANTLVWLADFGSRIELQASVLGFAPGPGPGPGPNPGPAPTPATPPSAPATAQAQARDGAATVSWTAPASQGSFPVTNYQVQSTPSSSGCLVPATSTECTVAGLSNGEEYTFEVRALNGGGWSPWADAGTVTPGPGPSPESSILITGSRTTNERAVRVEGRTTGLVGATVQAMVSVGGSTQVTPGSTRTVDADGDFTWQRRAVRSIEVYFTSGDISSNTVTIRERR